MTAVGEPAAKLKVISDTVARGDRLVSARTMTLGAAAATRVLAMFTNRLPNAHGVANDLFSADVARIRKSLGGVHLSGMGAAMGLAQGHPVMPGSFPALFPGGSAFGIQRPPVSTTIAALPGVTQEGPRQSRRPGRSSAASSFAQGAVGHYTPGPPGRSVGGRGRGARGGLTGAPPHGTMSASQLQMAVDVRNQRNQALQQQQLDM
ncbi:unnamed protein product [Ectocarpus sp. 8 AP-2014]